MKAAVRLAVAGLIVGALVSGAVAGGPAPYAAGRKGLERHVEALAAKGRKREVQDLLDILTGLGTPPRTLERVRAKCDKALAKAGESSDPQPRIAKLLRRSAAGIARALPDLEAEERKRIALLVLRLDGDQKTAHEVLGHVEVDGRWVTPDARAGIEREKAIAEAVVRGRELAVEIDVAPSQLPFAIEAGDGKSVRARWETITLHGAHAGETKLREVLTGLVRGLALSNHLQGGDLEGAAPSQPFTVVLCGSAGVYDEAVEKSAEAGGISGRALAIARQTSRYEDSRGFFVVSSAPAGFLKASLLVEVWHRWQSGYTGQLPQPALAAGHLNWLSLELFERPIPGFVFPKRPDGQTRAGEKGASGIEAVARSVAGAKAFLAGLVQRGEDPAFARSITQRIGKINREDLLKCTLVAAYLHEQETFGDLVRDTRSGERTGAAFEAAMGEPLAAFEDRWRKWMVPTPLGVAGRLE